MKPEIKHQCISVRFQGKAAVTMKCISPRSGTWSPNTSPLCPACPGCPAVPPRFLCPPLAVAVPVGSRETAGSSVSELWQHWTCERGRVNLAGLSWLVLSLVCPEEEFLSRPHMSRATQSIHFGKCVSGELTSMARWGEIVQKYDFHPHGNL